MSTINLLVENNNSSSNSTTFALPDDGKAHKFSSLKVVSGTKQFNAVRISVVSGEGSLNKGVLLDDTDVDKKADYTVNKNGTPSTLSGGPQDITNWTAKAA